MSRHSARTYAYKKAWRALRSLELPCWLCRQPIDYGLRYPHPRSFSADHYLPRAHAAADSDETTGLMPAHLECNQSRGDRAPARRGRRRVW